MKYWYSKLSENMKDKKGEYAKNKYHNISEKKKKAKIKRVSKKKNIEKQKSLKVINRILLYFNMFITIVCFLTVKNSVSEKLRDLQTPWHARGHFVF